VPGDGRRRHRKAGGEALLQARVETVCQTVPGRN
jgi:hypothetical protein